MDRMRWINFVAARSSDITLLRLFSTENNKKIVYQKILTTQEDIKQRIIVRQSGTIKKCTCFRNSKICIHVNGHHYKHLLWGKNHYFILLFNAECPCIIGHWCRLNIRYSTKNKKSLARHLKKLEMILWSLKLLRLNKNYYHHVIASLTVIFCLHKFFSIPYRSVIV